MMYEDEKDRKILLDKLLIDFENIKRIDQNIACELEKRFAFAEDCVKILFNRENNLSAPFDMLTDMENANYDPFFVGENVIRENIFPCGYVFKCIGNAHRLTEYMSWYGEMQKKNTAVFLHDSFGFENYNKKTADIKITLNEKLSFNGLMSYIVLCDFQVSRLNYDVGNNRADLTLDIQNKSYLFNIFLGLIKCYKVKVSISD